MLKKLTKISLLLTVCFYPLEHIYCQSSIDLEYQKGLELVKNRKFQEAYSIFKSNERVDDRFALEVGKMICRNQIKIVSQDLIETFEKFCELEKKGNFEASVFKGVMLLYGIGCTKNEANALDIFRSALKYNNYFAYRMLGYMYFNGTYLKKSQDSSFFYLTKAKEYGDINCYSRLAQIYSTGLKGKFIADSLTAKKILKEGCEKGDSYSCFGLAMYDIKKLSISNYGKSDVIDNLDNAINFGENPLAKNQLLILLEDINLKNIPKLKLGKYNKETLLSELSNSQNGFDLYNMARAYYIENINKERALYFLQKSEKLNCAEAYFDHAVFFSKGNEFLDIYKNYDSAEYYTNKSIEFGIVGYGNLLLGQILYDKMIDYVNNEMEKYNSSAIEDVNQIKYSRKNYKKMMKAKEELIQKLEIAFVKRISFAVKCLEKSSNLGVDQANIALCNFYKEESTKEYIARYVKETNFNFQKYCEKSNLAY
jgi:TPR repeat protein